MTAVLITFAFYNNIELNIHVLLPDTSKLADHFNLTGVDYTSKMSPGTGSGYNLAHIIKEYLVYKANWFISIYIFLILISIYLVSVEGLQVRKWHYVLFVLSFFLSYNYSPYMLLYPVMYYLGVSQKRL